MRFRRSWLGRNETEQEQPFAARSGTRSTSTLTNPTTAALGARPASTGAREEAQAKSEAPPPRHGEPWRVRRGCRPGPRSRAARHVGYRQRPCPAGPGGGYGQRAAVAQSMSMSMSKRLALAPSTHRSLRARLVLRRDGEPCRCRTRRVPASPDKITLGIDGCKLPGKEISRGEMGARITSVARSCGPTLAAARLVAPLMDCGYSVLSYGAPLLIVDHILL
jgi:hypothetical protein